ncbi:disintegrin and metalloproteinase domain-containing protein 12 isoform X4 [Chironomus tepperi]|uniref:disintegrin and metalloproteinase domain-containing protein 12 isoform X4 n=1 Tax=Chironomus tepperi TaxID=113505 RepID=UPI00391FB64D
MSLQSEPKSFKMIIFAILLQICSVITLDGVHIHFNKREADYTLDDSFWNEESPVGEVERLLKEYRQNQELVRKIGGNFYQIIYPVQLRHHEKMGISTREVGGSKVWSSLGKRNIMNSTGANSGYSGRGRTRTGKHFHRTSLLIKAFNHKFRLDLELNTQLLAPNIQQKHILPSGYPQDSHREIEHCYYHGTVKDYPGATAAFHTCNGVSGVIHVGNETFVIHPFYGGDLSKHPHVIFEARTKQNKGCANSGNLEWRVPRRQQHFTGFMDKPDRNGAGRFKRDVRDATKYIETAIIIDKAMFDKRNGSTRAEVVHDAIQVANIADLYFRTLNTRVSVVYIETWQGQNQAQIDGSKDISKAVSNFNDYTTRKLHSIDKDTTQLLTGEMFVGGEAGMSVPETVCTPKAVGISVDINTYEPHLLAGTMAHMIGHNIGMGHDDNRDECYCRDWHGCIMAQSIIGLENVQPYKFSECSRSDYIDALRIGHGLCLLNKPNEVGLGSRRNCGNGLIEDGEECDCGSFDDCSKRDPCCDPITCKLVKEAECASGPCCENCQLKTPGSICREAHNECDLPEMCTGESGQCPVDVYKKNGSPCGATNIEKSSGYCFNGMCPTLGVQCEKIWGYGGAAAEKQCYEQFNSKGSMNGHCGMDQTGRYIKCEPENVQCGSLQCKDGDSTPIIEGMDQLYSRTIISIRGVEYECKNFLTSPRNRSTSGTLNELYDFPEHGLVRDGTPCGENLVCVNQTCVSIFPYIDTSKCPVSHNNQECSGNGVCTNTNKCHCEFGWAGTDCSTALAITTTIASATTPVPDSGVIKMERKETPYENYHGSNTGFLVAVLVSVVSGVFITFALVALCYRSVVVHKNIALCLRRKTTRLKYDPPYAKKPMAKYVASNSNANHHTIEEMSLDPTNKYNNQMFNNQNQFGTQKLQIRRMTGTGAEEEPMHSGANAVSDVEHTLKTLNGYHEDILEALKNAVQQRSSGNTPSGSISEEILRKTLQECAAGTLGYGRGSSRNSSRENICENNTQLNPILNDGASAMLFHHRSQQQLHQPQQAPVANPQQSMQQPGQQSMNPDDEVGPLRIRNLEDLIRQLEHHSSRHMSPTASEDINNSYGMSETEADRHYRLESSAACSESSHGSRCRQRSSDDENRFMSYGRYQQRSNRHQHHQPNSPHSFNHIHHSHAHLSSHGHSSHHSSHTHLHQDEEGIYESADPRERNAIDLRDANDSESDDFIQAQQQLARWASEDVVSVVVMESDSSAVVPSPVTVTQNIIPHLSTQMPQPTPLIINGLGVGVSRTDYYPSPPSTTETESSGSVMLTQRRGIDVSGGPHQENTGRYPEYKH